MAKRIVLTLLLLPAAEVVVFLLVVWAVGFLPALGLMVLTSVAGAVVLRHAGRGQVAQVRRAARQGGVPPPAESRGMMLALGGILLLLPGFITDLVGAGLLVGPIRRRLGATIGRAVGAALGGARAETGPGAVIDLAPNEWQAVPDQTPAEDRSSLTGRAPR